ncbi:MAG TPA: UvrD-helicase domain-containing protein [Treponemataceae bacterium]|nr:UvrD-helicase domain-containing protein [Treponemataceae bacterium]
MKQYHEILTSLDTNQQQAATIDKNAVIAAGAGSGKTRVLSARYVHLVVERGLAVDQILTLTFTTKAAAEMYSRIHATLRETDHPNARAALESFHLAKIQTIDSFCNAVARSACRSYGVSPDFSIDADQARRLAESLALAFFLEHRTSRALSHLLKNNSMANLPAALFAETMIRHSPISAPIDFPAVFERQCAEMEQLLEKTLDAVYSSAARLGSIQAKSAAAEKLRPILENFPVRPDPSDRNGLIQLLAASDKIAGISKPGNAKNPDILALKEELGNYKDHWHGQLAAVSNFILNRDIIRETFSLLAEFQQIFNTKKREAGILTFTDVSRMAVDALVSNPELRSGYKNGIKAVMIDEFQDDNDLQKDLLFLLAEKEERRDCSLPRPDELCPDKLFFVGDEKQSIYRFRGADVSVFRTLARELGEEDMPRLDTNYRTEKPLLDLFNRIFPAVFLATSGADDTDIPLYEARFAPIQAFRNHPGLEPRMEVHLAFADEQDDGDDPDALDHHEAEAEAVARTISGLLASGYPVRDGESVRPVRSEDIAILFRSGTRQYLYERFLREYGIPSQSETLRGLFSDAPVNDLYALLRLAVFPRDTTAYAALLRSPFVAVGDDAFTLALLDRISEDPERFEPFSMKTADNLSGTDRERFLQGRSLYEEVRARADRMPVTELVSDLWYRLGYRYSLITNSSIAQFSELYDYFFELARQSDEMNQPIAVFLDSIADTMDSGEKIDNLDIPVERTGGVRLMTVHKSKGLEFPVVFLVDASYTGNKDTNREPVHFSREAGLSINTASPDDCESAGSNWFYERDREEERRMNEAELRRLLYVAMTRAETALYITGKITGKLDDDDDTATPSGISAILARKLEKKRPVYSSFLDLLLPVLSGDLPDNLLIRAISAEDRNSAAETAGTRPAAGKNGARESDWARLDMVPVTEYKPSRKTRFPVTALHIAAERPYSGAKRPRDELDRLLEEQRLTPAEFGTIAHRVIESGFTGLPATVPAGVQQAANDMAKRFFASALGDMALKAAWREAEYSFITRQTIGGQILTLTGQADLVFEHDGEIHVVDYKTDSVEDPEEHRFQLSIYRLAVSEIMEKPVKTWIFYLRSGNAVFVDTEAAASSFFTDLPIIIPE